MLLKTFTDSPPKPLRVPLVGHLMQRGLLLSLVFWFVAIAAADFTPVHIWWKGNSLSYHLPWPSDSYSIFPAHEYPLTFLVDGDPKTAWMVGGVWQYDNKKSEYYKDFSISNAPTLTLSLDSPKKIDGLRLMPGYNKDERRLYGTAESRRRESKSGRSM